MAEVGKLSKRIDNTVRLGEVESVDSGSQTLTIVGGPKDIPHVLGVSPAVGDLVVYATNAGDSVTLGQTTGGTGKPATTQAGTSYTLTLSDASTSVLFSNASLATVTIPLEASVDFPIGTHIAIQATGAGGVTVSTSATLNGSSPNASISQNEVLVAEKTGSDTWSLLGGTSA